MPSLSSTLASPAIHAGRYAPSPTGDLHVGNMRTALLAWSFARNAHAHFVLRFEDLDPRCKSEYIDRQRAQLEALGLTWESEYFQSEHIKEYAHALHVLKEQGMLYECYCSRKDIQHSASAPHGIPGCYHGTCRFLTKTERISAQEKLYGRGPAIRIALTRTGKPERHSIHDYFSGEYEGEIDDFVLERSDGVFSYNFTSVYDDYMSGINHIVRGDDLLASASRQEKLTEIFSRIFPSHTLPLCYMHVPLLYNARGIRLAKRDGAVTYPDLINCGWKAEDIIALIAATCGFDDVRNADDFAECAKIFTRPNNAPAIPPALLDTDRLGRGPQSASTLRDFIINDTHSHSLFTEPDNR